MGYTALYRCACILGIKKKFAIVSFRRPKSPSSVLRGSFFFFFFRAQSFTYEEKNCIRRCLGSYFCMFFCFVGNRKVLENDKVL